MRAIPLRTLAGDPGQPDIEYAQVLREVMRRPLNPQAGAGIPEMRNSIRVLDAIDKSNGVLELEDADYDHLREKLFAMPWNIVDRRIIELVDDVTSAPSA